MCRGLPRRRPQPSTAASPHRPVAHSGSVDHPTVFRIWKTPLVIHSAQLRSPGWGAATRGRAAGVRARPQAQPGVGVIAECGAPRAKAGAGAQASGPAWAEPGCSGRGSGGGTNVLGAWLRRRGSGGRAGRPQASGRRPDSTASPGSPGPRGRRPLAAPGVRLPPRERRARWPRGRRHRRGAHALGRPPRALPTGGERGRLLEPFSTYYILERMAVYRDSFFFLQLHSYSNCLLINIGLFLLLPWCHKESFSSRVASHFGHYASGISS